MAQPADVIPVKFFVTVLFSDEEKLSEARDKLVLNFGEIDYESEKFVFNETNYYRDEMGDEIGRIFWSFRSLRVPDFLVHMKRVCFEVEIELAVKDDLGIRRKVNIDPGYIDFHKVVLATFKGGGQKLYIGQGVWADIILMYERGKFRPFLRTFPDFQSGKYDQVLLAIRKIYRDDLRLQG